MKIFKTHWDTLFLLIIMAAAIAARLYFYGDPRLSIGNLETQSYISSANAPLFSWDSFAGKRLFTTNLIYKIADRNTCPPTAISYPGAGTHEYRKIQPCFDEIALLQNLLSIIGWCYLAWSTSRWLTQPPTKILIAGLILAFAFTPQIAEWDSLLSPESLSFSLFIITFSLLQEILFQLTRNNRPINSRRNLILIAGWLCVFFLWVFARDVHLYTVLVTIVLLALLFFASSFRRTKILFVIIAILTGIFLLGFISARDSLRATYVPLRHSFDEYILPYPTRVEFFRKYGMPDPGSPAYQAWFDSRATETYAFFLLSHPGFVITTLWDRQYFFKTDSSQPYFELLNTNLEGTLLMIGQFVHPETIAIYLIDAIFFAMLCYGAITQQEKSIIGWTWLAAWFFLGSLLTLFVSFFGDTLGVQRHVFPSVESFRLFFWIYLLYFIDKALVNNTKIADREVTRI